MLEMEQPSWICSKCCHYDRLVEQIRARAEMRKALREIEDFLIAWKVGRYELVLTPDEAGYNSILSDSPCKLTIEDFLHHLWSCIPNTNVIASLEHRYEHLGS